MNNLYSYISYGLSIHSLLPLPELTEATGIQPDVIIRVGRVDRPRPQIDHTGCYFQVTPTEAYLFWENVGGFLIRDGREITVDPIPGVKEQLVRLPLLGAVLSLVIHQRGFLGLHGSAVAIEGQAVTFIGASGMGKSTMAASLYSRGHSVLADDLVVLAAGDGATTPLLFPSFPQLKLFPEAVAASMGNDGSLLPRLMPELDKRACGTPDGFSQEPFPLRCIYILDNHANQTIEPIEPKEILVHLIRHSYGARIFKQWLNGATASSHFLKCVSLANRVPVRWLRRPRNLSMLEDVSQMVEEDIGLQATMRASR